MAAEHSARLIVEVPDVNRSSLRAREQIFRALIYSNAARVRCRLCQRESGPSFCYFPDDEISLVVTGSQELIILEAESGACDDCAAANRVIVLFLQNFLVEVLHLIFKLI